MAESVRDRVWEYLAATGTSVVFGNPGSTELPFFADWPERVRWVMALQEASAVAMADGYAQATGRPSLVTLHSAAGLGNGLCSVYTAFRNRSPVVVLAGQQVRSMHPTDPYLYAEQSTVFPRPYVKWAIEPARAQDVPLAFARALHTAAQRPAGPVFLSVPMDDWDTPAPAVPLRTVGDRFAAGDGELADVAQRLSTARSPVLVVGSEVEREGATALAIELAERTGAAVWVSPHINRTSFPEEHPCFRGQLQPTRKLIREALKDADLVVVLGAPVFVYHVPSDGPCVPQGTELFQLSEDPAVLARADTGTGIRTSLREGIAGLLGQLPEHPDGPLPEPVPRPAPELTAPMRGEYVLRLLGGVLPPDTVIVEEAPTFREVRWRHMPVRQGGDYYNAASGGLGWGLPASVGIALADPSRPVVCLLGDGSAQYSIQALWTAAQLGLRLIVIVLNNGEYAAMKDLSLTFGAHHPPSYDLPGIDITHHAQGYGCTGLRAEGPDSVVEAARTALATQTTTVIDIPIDPRTTALYT
ncbi:benzoylformate decarboxylase [Streptomyces sp. NPDC093064]|uniref:benzoylformate decarboxylase n=1 Tax=Streptomyces sp. NPDC093064 TaxID=3366020 RepID=UPI003821B3CD